MPALVDPKKVILPPLHNVKLGLIKNFVIAMVKFNNEGEGFQYIKSKLPKISDVKIKGVFIGPQIKELIKDPFFEEKLDTSDKAAWNAFKSVTQNFLGNDRSPDYEQTVETLLHVQCYGICL